MKKEMMPEKSYLELFYKGAKESRLSDSYIRETIERLNKIDNY